MRSLRVAEASDRREVDYLPLPVNDGMVPRTLADDGDALAIVCSGAAWSAGTWRART